MKARNPDIETTGIVETDRACQSHDSAINGPHPPVGDGKQRAN